MESNKKILLAISSSYCANFISGQTTYLKQHGYAVSIVSAPGEEISALAKKEGATLYNVPFTKNITPFYDLVLLWRCIKILKKDKPNIVNAGNPKSGLLVLLAAYIVGVKARIFTLHGLPSDSKQGIKKFIISLAEKLTCRLAKKIIVVSPSLKEHAIQRGIAPASKCVVLQNASCNGLNTDYFTRTASVQEQMHELKTKLAIQSSEFVIGYAGRINYDKGITFLLDVFLELIQVHTNMRLLLVGPLQTENAIPKKYEEIIYSHPKILFTGKLQQMAPAYACMNVLILPSFREGFGYVLIEAASMQVPVIAPNIPGCKDAVLHNQNGFLYTPQNKSDLKAKIETYYNNPTLREEHGKAGRNWVVQSFKQEAIWQGQLSLYQQLS
jgi:glycosyltransferase involved in cell wall biosynthesis